MGAPVDPQEEVPSGEPIPVLLLHVAGRAVAVATGDVAEVARLGAVTPLAGTPTWVRGVTAVRGVIVPVVDLLGLLGEPSAAAHAQPAAAGGGAEHVVVVVRGAWRAALVGATVAGVAEGPCAPGAAARLAGSDAPGLPVRGAVRPERGGAPDREAPPVPLLDVAALLHELHDDAPEPAPDPP